MPVEIAVIGALHLKNFDGVSDRAQRISQFVRQDCNKVVLLPVGFQELPFHFFSLGNIAGDLGGPNDRAVGALDRRNS